MNKVIYIHTIDKEPAFFDGDQIVFANACGQGSQPIKKYAKSLKQIQDEVKKTVKYRRKCGFNTESKSYGYFKVKP